jgi:hypothetical protein
MRFAELRFIRRDQRALDYLYSVVTQSAIGHNLSWIISGSPRFLRGNPRETTEDAVRVLSINSWLFARISADCRIPLERCALPADQRPNHAGAPSSRCGQLLIAPRSGPPAVSPAVVHVEGLTMANDVAEPKGLICEVHKADCAAGISGARPRHGALVHVRRAGDAGTAGGTGRTGR